MDHNNKNCMITFQELVLLVNSVSNELLDQFIQEFVDFVFQEVKDKTIGVCIRWCKICYYQFFSIKCLLLIFKNNITDSLTGLQYKTTGEKVRERKEKPLT